jgi:alkylhydroperoxidase family enzyme
VILRVGYLCRAGYEWAQHARLGQREGLTESEIARIKQELPDSDWNERDRLLLQATGELHRDYFISDLAWQALTKHLSTRQCMELVFIVGHYTQVCMILNTFGVQLDGDLVEDKDLNQF